MAADPKKLQPIIIKRVKKSGHTVHGGAWKIAYADFVTAMMAFFLLMWLLGSTSEGDKKALTVNVTSSTRYMFFRNEQSSSYTELTSLVEVVDTNQPEIIAKTTIYSYNAWRNVTSDFTEIDHARSITKFLERIVR